MNQNLYEIYTDVEKAIELAFSGKFVLDFYEYLKTRGVKKIEIEEFINSTTSRQIDSIVDELDGYLEGGQDSNHKQLREGYGHIPKPQARKIRNYLSEILEDAQKYSYDKRPGRRKKVSK